MKRTTLRGWLLCRLLPCLLLLATTIAAPAQQPPGWGWVNTLGGFVPNATQFNDVAGLGRDAAGNLYLFGTTAGTPPLPGAPPGSAGGSDLFLAKYSAAGALLWWRTLQSSGGDQATALFVEPSGRCTLTGLFGFATGDNLSFASFGPAAPPLAGPALLGLATSGGYYTALTFVAAVDASGTFLWANTVSSNYDLLTVNALHRDNSGNCYVAARPRAGGQLVVNGQSYPAIGYTDAVLLKYTPTGQVAWVRRVGVSGGYLYSGEIQTDNAGALYWVLGHDRTITLDGHAIPALGSGLGNTGNTLLKLSAANTFVWARNNLLVVNGAQVLSGLLGFDAPTNALYLACGSTGGPITYAGSGSPVTVGPSPYTACVARCDTAGQVQWVKPFSYITNLPGGATGPRLTAIRGFAVRGTGFTLVTNTTSNNQTTYYGAPRSYGLGESGLPCVLHFNTSSNQVEWIRVAGGTPASIGQGDSNEVKGVAIDGADNVFLAGVFRGTLQFGTTTLNPTSTSQPEIFLAKLDQSLLTAARPAGAGRAWGLYPNPTTGPAQLTGLPASARVGVYDAQGRLVQELPAVASPAAPRTVTGLRTGLYLLRVTHTADAYATQRLVIQ